MKKKQNANFFFESYFLLYYFFLSFIHIIEAIAESQILEFFEKLFFPKKNNFKNPTSFCSNSCLKLAKFVLQGWLRCLKMQNYMADNKWGPTLIFQHILCNRNLEKYKILNMQGDHGVVLCCTIYIFFFIFIWKFIYLVQWHCNITLYLQSKIFRNIFFTCLFNIIITIIIYTFLVGTILLIYFFFQLKKD